MADSGTKVEGDSAAPLTAGFMPTVGRRHMNHSSPRVKILQIRLLIAKGTIAEVREFIANPKVGDALLRHPESLLRKVEDYLSADCPDENEEAACYAIEQTLGRAETEISHVQKMGKQHATLVGS